ncbi:ParA family protein [Ornithinimicrobium sufpigmenti]|uniref:ParA family protein n=1 Tax=Ornithinimicrobium sufpigmenti TaxID=2508882 RepID=UPI00235626C5|nr:MULTISPECIES: ParA family protein [unclassified Ornithinimicrobium]
MSTSSSLGWPAGSTPSLPPTFRNASLGWPAEPGDIGSPAGRVPRETTQAVADLATTGPQAQPPGVEDPTGTPDGVDDVPRETTQGPDEAAAGVGVTDSRPPGTPVPLAVGARSTEERVARETRDAPWDGTRIITVSNQKGGVGKTTTAVNIAAAMALDGLQVLVVDMDPQGNASTALSIPHSSGTAGIYDVIIDGVPLAEVVQPCPQVPGLLCAPATIDLAGAEIELVPLVARENRLRRALEVYLAEQEQPVDLVIIDCPPSLGLLTVNAFVAAREVLIPIQCEYYALEGLSQLMKNVELIQQHLNADLRISTILLTMYDGRTRLASDVADQVREYFGDRVLSTAVPRSVRVSEAPSHGETVMTYDPGSAGALSYAEAAAEMRRQEV